MYVSILEKIDKMEKLAGVILLVEGKILLVQSNKNKNMDNDWSIPKGKVDKGEKRLECAIRELEEETGVKIKKDAYDHLRIYYKKNNVLKELTAFIVNLSKEDLGVKIEDDKINRKFYNTEEIYKAKFFTLGKAYKKLQVGQRLLLKNI